MIVWTKKQLIEALRAGYKYGKGRQLFHPCKAEIHSVHGSRAGQDRTGCARTKSRDANQVISKRRRKKWRG